MVSWFCDLKGFLVFNISRCSHWTWNRLDDRGCLRYHSFNVSWFHEFCDFRGFVVFIGFVIIGFIERELFHENFSYALGFVIS